MYVRNKHTSVAIRSSLRKISEKWNSEESDNSDEVMRNNAKE